MGRGRIELSQIQVLQTCALPTELPPPKILYQYVKEQLFVWSVRESNSHFKNEIHLPGHLAEPTKTKNGLLIF